MNAAAANAAACATAASAASCRLILGTVSGDLAVASIVAERYAAGPRSRSDPRGTAAAAAALAHLTEDAQVGAADAARTRTSSMA